MDFDYEVVVIGGGPGGYVAAIKAAQNGKRTCIIEDKHFGGTCLNEGCIPTKVLLKAVEVLNTVERAEEFGVRCAGCSKSEISPMQLQERKNNVVRQLVGGVEGLLRMNKVSILLGKASFIDQHTVQVNDEKVTGETFIIATGSKTFMPPFIPIEGNANVMTSTDVLAMEHIPESIVIIGAGVIGIEFAHFFSHTKCKVTVLELMDSILPMVDKEISRMVEKRMKMAGVNFVLGAKVKAVKDNTVIYEYDGKEEKATAETVLMAVGRTPVTEGLNVEKINIEFDNKAIKTDAMMRTNLPNIYAIGDVNGKSMLAHTATHEGLIAVKNICSDAEEKMNYNAIPACIYIEPEVASIGYTEEQARSEFGDNIRVGKFPMMANGKMLIEGESKGLFKVITVADTGQVVGAHLYGSHATEMISELTTVIANHISAEEMLNVIHPHPTVSEAVGEMFMSAWNGAAIHSR